MLAKLDMAKPDTGNIRSLNLVAIKHQAYDRSSDKIAVVAGATNDRAGTAMLSMA
jgi:hypothetical protein